MIPEANEAILPFLYAERPTWAVACRAGERIVHLGLCAADPDEGEPIGAMFYHDERSIVFSDLSINTWWHADCCLQGGLRRYNLLELKTWRAMGGFKRSSSVRR